MIETLTYLLPVFLMVFLLLIGVPIAYSLAISGTIGLYFFIGANQMIGILTNVPFAETTTYQLSVLPMFVLMAQFIAVSGLATDAFEAGQRWLGHVPGGLAMAATISNGAMAVLSGSSLASAATMAAIGVPEMRKHGYADRLSMGTVTAAGTFAIMLPPSVALIVYGIWTETSIAALFMAGIVPGIITLLGYLGLIFVWAKARPDDAGTVQRYSWGQRGRSMVKLAPATIIIFFVLGGIYSGAITPTEAGGVGAASALLVGVTMYGTDLSDTYEALTETARITSTIFFIIIGAIIFTRYLAFTGLTQQIIDFIVNLPVGVLGQMALVLLVILFMGMFINQIAVMILTLPFIYPMFVMEWGYSPIWLGIIIIKTVEIGLVTPPLGMNIYVATSTVDVDVGDAFKGAAPFVIIDLLILVLMIAFPEIVTWFPEFSGTI